MILLGLFFVVNYSHQQIDLPAAAAQAKTVLRAGSSYGFQRNIRSLRTSENIMAAL